MEAVTQLTDDAIPKIDGLHLATDGTRVYFNEGEEGDMKIAQVAAGGDPTSLLPVKMSNPTLEALSADGASLLATEVSSHLPPYASWKIQLPGEEARRMLELDAQDAAYFPDGRIVFARGTDLNVAENDGSSPHKLFGADRDKWLWPANHRRKLFTGRGLLSELERERVPGVRDSKARHLGPVGRFN